MCVGVLVCAWVGGGGMLQLPAGAHQEDAPLMERVSPARIRRHLQHPGADGERGAVGAGEDTASHTFAPSSPHLPSDTSSDQERRGENVE